jgi:hypothetical protein
MLAKALTILSLGVSALASPVVLPRASSLPGLALQKVLNDASPIFGYYTKNDTKYSTWMSEYPDSTQFVHSKYSQSQFVSLGSFWVAVKRRTKRFPPLENCV